MTITELCERDVVTLGTESSLVDAAKIMRSAHVGYVVVVEESGRKQVPLGIVTDRDIVMEAIATELDPDVITVGDIMLQSLFTVRDGTDLVQTLEIMTTEGVRRLPIVDESDGLVGVATLEGLLIKMAEVFGRFSTLIAKERENELVHRG